MSVPSRAFRPRAPTLRSAGLALSVSFLFAGCTQVPSSSSSTAPSTTAPAKSQPPPLKVGMSADEVRAAWGAPTEILPLENSPAPGETWRYRSVLRSTQRQVAANVQEVPYFDPISGLYIPQKEITHTQETVSQVQITDLIMVEDKLVGWKRSLNEERSFP